MAASDVDEPKTDGDVERKGPVDKQPRRKPGPSTRAREREQTKREQRRESIADAIAELAELGDALRNRGGDPADDAAAIARRDGDLMADVLAELADHFAPLGLFVDNLLGMPVKALRAFGPITRKLLARARELRRQRDEVAADFARRLFAQAAAEGKAEPRDGDRLPFEGAVFEFSQAANAWNEVPAAQLEAEARALSGSQP